MIARVLCEVRIGGMLIVNDAGTPVGMITRSDILWTVMHHIPLELWIGGSMTGYGRRDEEMLDPSSCSHARWVGCLESVMKTHPWKRVNAWSLKKICWSGPPSDGLTSPPSIPKITSSTKLQLSTLPR